MTARSRYQPAAASAADFLHVSCVGLRVDHVPAGPLWNRIRRQASPDEEAPEPPRSLDTCREDANLFRSAALRAALTYRAKKTDRGRFVENYPVPALAALPTTSRLDAAAQDKWSREYLDKLQWLLNDGPAGMAFHRLGLRSTPYFEAGGGATWFSAMNAFDTQGDLNSLVVWAEDGYAARADLGQWENPPEQPQESLEKILSRPKLPGQLRDVFSAVLLLRPEAAEWLQQWSPYVRDASQTNHFPNGVIGRSRHGFGGLNALALDDTGAPRAALGEFKPTPNVPQLWSQPQWEQYAQMPTLALLHKPGFARFTPGMSVTDQGIALEAALRFVLEGALRDRPPKRLFYSAAPGPDGPALLTRSLANVAPQSGLLAQGVGFRLEQCLGGELGAGSMNAGIGLASIAAWETDEPALVVNLRDPGAALVFGVRPPDAAHRARQNARPYVI